MNTAHNTLIQFLHYNRDCELSVKKLDLWHIALLRPNGRILNMSSGSSYESACAHLTAQLPKL